MKKPFLLILVAAMMIFAALLTACSGSRSVAPFQTIDLTRDLDKETLARYRAQAANADWSAGGGHSAVLEKTNWWPLSLVAFWHRGRVETMHAMGDQPGSYTVSKTFGLGPLAVLFVSKEDAIFGEDGAFQSGMKSWSVGWGHVAMAHEMRDATQGAGGHGAHRAWHLFHHALNISTGHGEWTVGLFSAPNPIEVSGKR